MVTSATRGRPRKATIEKTIDDYYRRLARMESKALQDIDASLKSALKSLDNEISVVLNKISKANVFQDTKDLSNQLMRLQALQTQAQETLTRFGDDTARAIRILQTNATDAGEQFVIRSLNN